MADGSPIGLLLSLTGSTGTPASGAEPIGLLLALTKTTGAGSQTLVPSLFTNTNTFFTPTITTGPVTLLPGLFTNANIFYTPTITGGTQPIPETPTGAGGVIQGGWFSKGKWHALKEQFRREDLSRKTKKKLDKAEELVEEVLETAEGMAVPVGLADKIDALLVALAKADTTAKAAKVAQTAEVVLDDLEDEQEVEMLLFYER